MYLVVYFVNVVALLVARINWLQAEDVIHPRAFPLTLEVLPFLLARCPLPVKRVTGDRLDPVLLGVRPGETPHPRDTPEAPLGQRMKYTWLL